MSTSTPIDQLDGGAPAGPAADQERVKRILAEMNAGDMAQPAPALAPLQQVITEPPLSISTGQLRMDAPTARAHVIGNSQPTMADFQAMFQSTAPGMAPLHGAPYVADPGPSRPVPKKQSSGSFRDLFVSQVRAPLAVAAIMFLLSLPVVTSILSRYAAWMYLSSGEISIGGLLIKALLAGVLFAIYQTAVSLFDRD